MYDRNERIAALETLLAEHAIDGNLNRRDVPVLVNTVAQWSHLPSAVPVMASHLVAVVAQGDGTEGVVVDVMCWVASLADG